MERDVVCFPAPIDACVPLTYGARTAAVQPEDDGLDFLRDGAEEDCYICKLDELLAGDWD